MISTLQPHGLEVRGLHSPLHKPMDLVLPACSVVGVSGPSGAGKSALLAALAGLLPASGEIHWRGHCWQKPGYSLPLHQRPLSLGFQDARLFPGLSVARNLELAERYQRRPLDGALRSHLLDACAIRELLPRPVEQLSGGEAQRVALLRLLFNNAPVQFFDEPLSALDWPLRAAIIAALGDYWEQCPALVLWVSHDWLELRELAQRVIWLRDGGLAEPDPAFLNPSWQPVVGASRKQKSYS